MPREPLSEAIRSGRLCYNPEARVSDFFRIFYDEPVIVGPFDDRDWKDLYAGCGIKLDGSAERCGAPGRSRTSDPRLRRPLVGSVIARRL